MNRRAALGALAGVAAAACTRAADDRLVLWHAYRGGELEALEAAVAQVTAAHPELAVRLVAIPFDAFVNKVSVAVPNGNGPDLVICGHDRVGDWASRGFLEPVGFWVDRAHAEGYFPRTLDALMYRGGLYGLPLAFKTLALYHDTTLAPTPPATTDALIAQAKALRARDPKIQGIAWELDSLYFHAPWLHGFGGAVYADEHDTLALDSPAAAASLRFVRRLLASERIIPEEATSALITGLFRGRQLAFVVSGPWFRGELNGHDRWAVAPLPIVSETGLPARPFLGVEAVLLSAKGRRKRDAFALAAALAGDAVAATRWRVGGQLVARKAVYADPTVAADPIARAFRAQVDATVALSNRPHMRRVWTPMQRALGKAVVRDGDAAAALTEARRAIEKAAAGPDP